MKQRKKRFGFYINKDCLYYIFEFIEYSNLIKIKLVCKEWNYVINWIVKPQRTRPINSIIEKLIVIYEEKKKGDIKNVKKFINGLMKNKNCLCFVKKFLEECGGWNQGRKCNTYDCEVLECEKCIKTCIGCSRIFCDNHRSEDNGSCSICNICRCYDCIQDGVKELGDVVGCKICDCNVCEDDSECRWIINCDNNYCKIPCKNIESKYVCDNCSEEIDEKIMDCVSCAYCDKQNLCFDCGKCFFECIECKKYSICKECFNDGSTICKKCLKGGKSSSSDSDDDDDSFSSSSSSDSDE